MNRIYIPLEAVEAYGESTGRSLPISGTVSARQVEQLLRRALKQLARKRDSCQSGSLNTPLSESCRWLLDNFYLAQREGLDSIAAFHRAGRLPAAEGEAVIVALCRALLSSGGGTAEEERCLLFLKGFQKKTVLSGRELSLFAAALRTAAILRLAELYQEDEPQSEAAGALFGALRLWSTLDMAPLLEKADRTEQILREDPAEIYPKMDEGSRRAYRRQVQRLARRRGIPEHRAAARAIRLAREAGEERCRHVGYFLFVRPLGDSPRPRTGAGYIALNAIVPVGLSLAAAFALSSPAAGVLLWLPLWQAIKTMTDMLIRRYTTPRHLPRLALEDGVPEEGRTLCVISTLLTDEDCAAASARRLEEFYHASRACGRGLMFGLLCDLPENEQAQTQADRLLLQRAAQTVEELNRRYGGGFYLLYRPRSWSRDTGRFTGWERKRGALLELAHLLTGEKSSLQILSGESRRLKGTRYILTLDADTRLLPDSARQLIGAALHPLNRPIVDLKKRLVVAGHGVIQPRIATELTAAQATSFSRLFAPQGGTDPYGGDAGEVYMDLFESGGFAGKGLLDIRAFLLCMDKRLPENTVLSHDALEGAFLRGGLMADTELTDGFPETLSAYYKRLHRWIRGDWQNTPWLFHRGKELPIMEKWRLLDSLRRSLTPAWTLSAVLAGLLFPSKAMTATAAVALVCFALPLITAAFHTALEPEELARLRLLSGVYHGLSAALMKTALEFILLPYEAWVCLSAAATALWRMLISHKNMLLWQTAAQTSQGKSPGIEGHYRSMWVVLPVGGLCLLLSGGILGRTLGFLWLLSPALAASLNRPRGIRPPLPPADRDWLRQQAASIWRYYRDFCTKEENFLPPDNFQDSPPVGLAHRTSPTNIGLGLIAALCALDLKLAPRPEVEALLESMLTTLESLPKWNGHLYNWYDTRTLRPLEPKYVSTVDSGNLAGCLLVLREGLTEYNLTETKRRAETLRAAMDFRPLYDDKRHLFRIGLEPENPAPAKSWYDLLESEERLTGYLAIATGQVPRRHWSRLSRAQVGCDGFRGMASWTGTMFEYLMPELFLPLYRDSLLYESARFALYVQRRRTAGKQNIWGSSESAFYALDAALNYRYKAHGAPRLALCRGMEQEQVYAPYSSFLALTVNRRASLANLRAMETLGMVGPYGFWEAIDFTPSRADEKGCIVRCVMAHHLGMSLAAITNTLLDDILPRRFMNDPAMAACAPLLQEKVPLGGLLLRRREKSPPPPRRTEAGSPRQKEGVDVDFVHPVCTALSNGVYSLVATESGLSCSRCAGILPYRSPRFPLGDGQGLELLYRQEGQELPLLPAPDSSADFSWRLTGSEILHTGCTAGMDWTVNTRVSRHAAGELRHIRFHRPVASSAGEILLRFEPVLTPERDYRSHPSFSRLGLEVSQQDGILLIRRQPRGKQGLLHMALACSRQANYAADGSNTPRRPHDTGTSGLGWQSEGFVTARVTLPAGEVESEVSFALCIASSAEEACRSARSLLTNSEGFDMARAAAAAMGMTEESADAALDMLPALVFPHLSQTGEDLPGVTRNGLWSLGISGDLPILAVECTADEAMAAAEEQLRRQGLLSACGVNYDLVFLTDDGGEYLQPRRSALEGLLRQLGRETSVGIPGGVHFVPVEQRPLLQATAALYGREMPQDRQPRRLPASAAPKSTVGSPPAFGWGSDGSFALSLKGTLPPRSWGNLLTNGHLSYFAADCGTGSLWLDNARECPLTPWRGDPLATLGPERLWAEFQGRRLSLFATPGEQSTRVIFAPGCAVWEKVLDGLSLRLTAFIPPEGNVRIFLLESSAPCTVSWCAPLQMAPEAEDALQCSLSLDGGIFSAGNPRCPREGLLLRAGCSEPWLDTATDTLRFLAGESHRPRRCGVPGFAGSFPLEREAVLVCGTEDLTPWLTPDKARSALEETRQWWQTRVYSLTAETPDRDLNRLLFGWAAYQTLACRILGRSSPYQSGGAIGFRDQLQDRVNLIPMDPSGCREHILLCCAHQFREGDVQHWWHPAAGEGPDKGVRTRCSDDLLWLPWALCEYVEQTGDESLCAETAPWLHSAPLGQEDSRYETPEILREESSVLAHCRRALELVLVRGVGQHDLLLMGSGDWNDGFDAMGEGAESVWLSWFFSITAHNFSRLLKRLGEPDADKYEMAAKALGQSADRAWEGDRYLRGYYGDGTPLGSQNQPACCIDSIAQSFAALCPYADPEKVDIALDTALTRLWDRESDMVRLYAPSFTGTERAPGYVAGYGPGFRENGGQYTHAAMWLAMACFRRNRPEDGAALLRCACASQRDPEMYGAEPFVIPADIYVGDRQGRGGWSWYTGSAGWFFSVVFRELLGFRLKDGKPELQPCLPPDWPGYTGHWVDSQGRTHSFGVREGGVFFR